jgi:large subunit ribosomal protein L13
MAKRQEIEPQWHVVDASQKPLGRMAVEVARLLQGKHRPTYTPHVLTGDSVIVVNAEKAKVTGAKFADKLYSFHSNYPGGLRQFTFEQMSVRNPEQAVKLAVKGMLPGSALAEDMLRRLHVYRGPDHPHKAQVNASQGKPRVKPEVKQ